MSEDQIPNHEPKPESRLQRFNTMSEEQYHASLSDVGFWAPLLDLVARQENLPLTDATAPVWQGRAPVFLADRLAVKLFCRFGEGEEAYLAEVAVARALGSSSLPVPRLVADGCIDVDGVTWPYTVTTRFSGRSLADVRGELGARQLQQVARTVGGWLRLLHEVPVSAELAASLPAWQPFLDKQRSTLAERLAQEGTLPDRLRVQAPLFVQDVLGARRVAPVLVHGDVYDTHILLTDTHASGMIDFGDARLADPLYEFPQLVCGALGPYRRLLAAALNAYRLPDDERALFARQALALTLCHEGDLLAEKLVNDVVHASATLDELAEALYGTGEQ